MFMNRPFWSQQSFKLFQLEIIKTDILQNKSAKEGYLWYTEKIKLAFLIVLG